MSERGLAVRHLGGVHVPDPAPDIEVPYLRRPTESSLLEDYIKLPDKPSRMGIVVAAGEFVIDGAQLGTEVAFNVKHG